MSPPEAKRPLAATLIATWATGCVLALLGQAIWRLTPLAIEPISNGTLSYGQIAIYVGWVAFSIYSEGYRGFHLRFSPRVVSRAFYLGDHPKPLHVILALPFAMSLFYTTKRQLLVSWIFLLVLVAVITAVRLLPQPWRGIIDGGVVIGLGLGALSIVHFHIQGLRGKPPTTVDIPAA